MNPTHLHLSRRHTVGDISPLIYGGFLEHMGRSIYEGVFQPTSPLANANGLRSDVVAALDELNFSIVRYPGGNFVSGYHWQDGVGPDRPTVRELAWQSIEPNTFGTNEFLDLCRRLDWTPMLAVNLGTGSPEEAPDWVEYCNAPAGSRWADLRVEHGYAEPHAVPIWCLGNEMDGPWQLGHVPAERYGERARQTAKMIKDLDRTVRTVVCGSSMPEMDSFIDWDATALRTVGGLGDYISLHRYVGNDDSDTPEYLAMGESIDAQIEAVDACCRFVQAARKSKKRAYLCFDEWNVWYKTRNAEHTSGHGQHAPHLIEEVYNLEDALVVAAFLMSFIRHADVVKIANIAQMVNVIAPILTRDPADGEAGCLRQSIFHTFRMFSSRKGGVSLEPRVSGPTYATRAYGEVPHLDCCASIDTEAGLAHLFLTNRHTETALPVRVHHDLPLATPAACELLTAPSLDTANTWTQPENVVPVAFDDVTLNDGEIQTELPPLSLAALSFRLAPA